MIWSHVINGSTCSVLGCRQCQLWMNSGFVMTVHKCYINNLIFTTLYIAIARYSAYVERSVHCSKPLQRPGRARLNKGSSLDITPTSLLHRSVSGGWGAGALLMTTSDCPPPLAVLQRWKSHRQLFCPDWLISVVY